MKTFSFDGFVFDAQRMQLTFCGRAVPLRNKPLEMLALLLSEVGKPVSQARMYDAIWSGAMVEDANVTQTVYVLRKAIAGYVPGRIFIRTIPKLGYQFVEPVQIAIERSPRRAA